MINRLMIAVCFLFGLNACDEPNEKSENETVVSQGTETTDSEKKDPAEDDLTANIIALLKDTSWVLCNSGSEYLATKTLISYSEKTYEKTVTTYDVTDSCDETKIKDVEKTYGSWEPVSIGTGALDDPYAFKETAIKREIAIHLQKILDANNTSNSCGHSDWQLGQFKDVSNSESPFCGPSQAEKEGRYTYFAITNDQIAFEGGQKNTTYQSTTDLSTYNKFTKIPD
jgi:hypothetical protein